MKLCIPTLNRYDLLKRLIESAEAGTLVPTEYVIIDNGRKFPFEEFRELLGEVTTGGILLQGPLEGGVEHVTPRARIIQPGRNLGVAPSWNIFLALREPVIISNDDIVLKPGAFKEMAETLGMPGQGSWHGSGKHYALVRGYGFALFGITPECVEKVGYFDESFAPAYFEDCDYELRARRAGILCTWWNPGVLAEHAGWSSSHATDDRTILDAPAKNRTHFIAKWGGVTGHCSDNDGVDPPLFDEPFNGSPPRGWGQAQRCPPRPMRYEIINTIARHIGATSYLEIGVADGESMRQVDIPTKHGVDPMPSPGGQRACTAYFPYTSRYFFEEHLPGMYPKSPLPTYHIVFIDGDHQAELVYQEVEWALARLSPGGVIVLHDCNPATEAMQTDEYSGGLWSGTVWKAIWRLRNAGRHAVRVVDSDYGVGIIVPGAATGAFERATKPTYADLEQDRAGILGLISGWEWEEWFLSTYGKPDRILHFEDLQRAAADFAKAPFPTFAESRRLELMTPAELRELQADPERWGRYQAFLRVTEPGDDKK